MSLPPILRDRLRLPVVASPLFIISNPDLVIAQCKAGVVGSFPSLNARPDGAARGVAADDHQRTGGIRPAASRGAVGAVRGEPDRAQVERPARARPRAVREVQGADHHHVARRAHRRERRGALVRRHHPARHHQQQVREEGDREGRRRADRGGRRRRRPCRHAVAVRADPGDPRVVRRARCCCRARSPTAARSWPRRRWVPTSPTSARPSSRPRKRTRSRPTSR